MFAKNFGSRSSHPLAASRGGSLAVQPAPQLILGINSLSGSADVGEYGFDSVAGYGSIDPAYFPVADVTMQECTVTGSNTGRISFVGGVQVAGADQIFVQYVGLQGIRLYDWNVDHYAIGPPGAGLVRQFFTDEFGNDITMNIQVAGGTP